MGGSGSGRWHSHITRDTVESCITLDVNSFVRDGTIKAGGWSTGAITWYVGKTEVCSIDYEAFITIDKSFAWLRLHYITARTEEDMDYKIWLTTTVPHFGGTRWWFTCPLVTNNHRCNRRVAKLYLPRGARYFGCRQCYDLTYKSCNLSGDPHVKFLTALSGKKPSEIFKILAGQDHAPEKGHRKRKYRKQKHENTGKVRAKS
jgi:hypothetical protein